MSSAIDKFLGHAIWRSTHRARLIPLGESARVIHYPAGELLFKQFHPADQLSLLHTGSVEHITEGEAGEPAWPMGRVSWPWAALGWSGFLPPYRNGTTARAVTDVELLTWRHEDLASIFYSDPLLAVDFFRLVLNSARLQFEWIRGERAIAQWDRPAHELVPVGPGPASTHRFAPGIVTTLRRSAFFERFEDRALERLAADARLVRWEANAEIVQQGEDIKGLWVLAAGDAVSYFSAYDGDEVRIDRFRTIPETGGILSGIPTIDGGYRAEATVRSVTTCWIYQIPSVSIEQFIADDPEFGRSFMQRQLARLSHLISSARLPKPADNEEPEIAAITAMLHQNQARLPVTSELHKIPHLLEHPLTVGNALACLKTARETGGYQERAVARSCTDMLTGVRAELHFYRDVLDVYSQIIDAPDEEDSSALRALCDEGLARAFAHLNTETHGGERLPESPGNIVIMNHLGCPSYYQLPNNYHFSFDTAFVSVLLNSRYGESPVRVVRRSPGVEYGHDLFYRRLGHIMVPTAESRIEADSPEVLDRLRRESAECFFEQGSETLARGRNILICPEGQAQKAADSPARLHSGAFRLALKMDPEPLIVPIAIAGFDRRYKDTRLIAVVQKPFRVSEAMRREGTPDLREFLDRYRTEFATAIREAERLIGRPARPTVLPDREGAPASPKRAGAPRTPELLKTGDH